ncbi:glycerophosphodiester phosphodiesterase family protein [Echinicola shivajiensis]|uniref:glycerophosphodiester phosphodiesterase family protein n=1 Tax=Echinicola shivajiensis TaxID=1035916 RepID=UPI001BFC864C|nr:glycerophosphodiester phosphodiesterase family protein [Echinicola shivajiensis]
MILNTLNKWGVCFFAISIISCSGPSEGQKSTGEKHYLQFSDVRATKQFFKWSPDREPMVSAHRGGSYSGYPENSIALFDYILDKTPSIIECDISMTKDSVLVMMHDNTLDRTSTGKGRVADMTFDEIKELSLVDLEGKVSEFKIPSLRDVLKWTKGKTVLTLDIKDNVPYELVLKEIEETETEAYVVLITYSLEAAKKLFHLNSELMLSVTIRNEEEWSRFVETGIPFENIIAFTGLTERRKSINKILHDHGVITILGVLGNLDKRAIARGDHIYRVFVENGADILATDRPIEVAKVIKQHNDEY